MLAPTSFVFKSHLTVPCYHLGCEPDGSVASVDPTVSLLALADVPPPPMQPRMREPRPVSSVTWHVDLPNGAPRAAPGGWWLLHSAVEHARDGYSTQGMRLWGEDLAVPAVVSRQCVAIFG